MRVSHEAPILTIVTSGPPHNPQEESHPDPNPQEAPRVWTWLCPDFSTSSPATVLGHSLRHHVSKSG